MFGKTVYAFKRLLAYGAFEVDYIKESDEARHTRSSLVRRLLSDVVVLRVTAQHIRIRVRFEAVRANVPGVVPVLERRRVRVLKQGSEVVPLLFHLGDMFLAVRLFLFLYLSYLYLYGVEFLLYFLFSLFSAAFTYKRKTVFHTSVFLLMQLNSGFCYLKLVPLELFSLEVWTLNLLFYQASCDKGNI